MREVIEETVEHLFTEQMTPAIIAAAETTWPTALWAAVEEAGIARASAPESQGGGVAWADIYVIVRALGNYAVPLPVAETLFVHWLLAGAAMEGPSGPMAFSADVLHLSEAGRVTGSLKNVPWGRYVGHVIAIAKKSSGSCSLVLLSARGISVQPGSNIAREPRDTLTFEHATPLAIGELPEGFDSDGMRCGGALIRSAQMAGGLRKILGECISYSQVRRQFGRAIGSFQAVQHDIAVLAEHCAAANKIAEIAFGSTGTLLPLLQVGSAKIVTSDAAGIGAALAHGIFGAVGVAAEHDLHFVTRRLWAWRSEFGSRELWAQQLGRLTCGAGEANFWSMITNGTFNRASLAEDAHYAVLGG